MSKTVYLLTGDIGGTNSRMGLYSVDDNMPLVVKTYQNQDVIKSKTDGVFERNVIAPFLQYCWETNNQLAPVGDVEIVACLAIAGPVGNNQVCMSNLKNIIIDGYAIEKQMYAPRGEPYLGAIKICRIINDFVAQGYGCLTLKPEECIELNPGSFDKINPSGPKVCVGAGTGLGECFLTPDAEGVYTCFPSEGGHVEWAPRNDLEMKLWKYLKEKFAYKNRVSVERVVSGRGLANCYEFLAQDPEYKDKVDPAVQAEFDAKDSDGNPLNDQGKIVSIQAHNVKGSVGEKAMEIMCGAYGCEVGSAGVKFIPTGGLYVTGGLTPKNIQFIQGQDSPFMLAYHDKGRVAPILENVPLFAVMVEDLGVRGALKNAQLEYERYHQSKTSYNPFSSKKSSSFSDSNTVMNVAQVVLAGLAGVGLGMTMKRNK